LEPYPRPAADILFIISLERKSQQDLLFNYISKTFSLLLKIQVFHKWRGERWEGVWAGETYLWRIWREPLVAFFILAKLNFNNSKRMWAAEAAQSQKNVIEWAECC